MKQAGANDGEAEEEDNNEVQGTLEEVFLLGVESTAKNKVADKTSLAAADDDSSNNKLS